MCVATANEEGSSLNLRDTWQLFTIVEAVVPNNVTLEWTKLSKWHEEVLVGYVVADYLFA
jgi:hypothetical protein